MYLLRAQIFAWLKNVGLEFYSTWQSMLYLLRIQCGRRELMRERVRYNGQYYELVFPVKGGDASFFGKISRPAAKKGSLRAYI